MTKELNETVNVEGYGSEEINKIIRQFEILFDLDYAVPDSAIVESEKGYVFIGKEGNLELDPQEAFELLLKFKEKQEWNEKEKTDWRI